MVSFKKSVTFYVGGHALSTYAIRGRGRVLPLRTLLHKCDVTYVVSPAYKGGRGSKSPEILRTLDYLIVDARR